MTIEELAKELNEIVKLGGGGDKVYIVNRFRVPAYKPPGTAQAQTEIAEVEQELEEIEPGDGLEHIFLLGKIE